MKLSLRLTLAFAVGALVYTAGIASAGDKPTTKTTAGEIRDLKTLLDAPNLNPMKGKTVRLDDVEVLALEGLHGFWIGTKEATKTTSTPRSLFVVMDKMKTDMPRAGDHVSLIGVITTAPPDGEIIQWRVGKEARERITKEGFYILASDVKQAKDKTALKY